MAVGVQSFAAGGGFCLFCGGGCLGGLDRGCFGGRVGCYLFLVVALVVVSSAAVLAKLANVPGPVAAWWRLGVGSLALSIIRPSLPTYNIYCLVAGAGLAAHFCLWFESLRYTSVAVSTMIVTTYPLWLGLVDLVARSIGWIEVAGLAIGLIGLTLFFYPIPASNLHGLLLSLGGSLAITVYFYTGRLARLQGQPAIDYSRATYLTAFLLVSAYLALTKTNPFEVKPSSIPPLILLGLGPMAIGHTLINYVLKHMPASKATSIILLEPYIAAILAALVLGETPKPTILPALTITGLGTITVSLAHRKQHNNS